MDDAERYRLLGTYCTPRFRYGRKVLYKVRGEVTICGLTDAPHTLTDRQAWPRPSFPHRLWGPDRPSAANRIRLSPTGAELILRP